MITIFIAVGGNGDIAVLFNGGAKWGMVLWNTAPLGLITNGTFSDISVPSATVAYTVGSNGMMAKTTNAGVKLDVVNTPLYAIPIILIPAGFDANNGYTSPVEYGWFIAHKLYRTTDGGAMGFYCSTACKRNLKVGVCANASYPGIDYLSMPKEKEIMRMQFFKPYGLYHRNQRSLVPRRLGIPNITNTTITLTTSQLTTGSHNTKPVVEIWEWY